MTMNNLATLNYDKLYQDNIVKSFLDGFASKETRRVYASSIKNFFKVDKIEYINKKMLLNIGNINIQHYITEMIDKKLSTSTIKGRIAALKSLYEYSMAVDNSFKNNPFDSKFVKQLMKRNLSKNIEDKGVALSKKEVESLLQEAKRMPTEYVMLKLLFNFGVRRSEIINLNWDSFFQDNGKWFVIIKGKGRKDRLIGVRDELIELLEKTFSWKFGSLKENKGKNYKLFDYTADNVTKIIKKWSRKVGLKVTPHDARRTCISELITQGININRIAEYVGHNSISTTHRYFRDLNKKENNVGFQINF